MNDKIKIVHYGFVDYIIQGSPDEHFCKKNLGAVILETKAKMSRPIKLGRTSWVSVRLMVFNATFNNISVTAWRSVLLVEEM